MAERRLGTLRHIVFILKTCMLNVANWFVSCSGIFAARTPAEEPCGSGNATDYRRLIGIMGLSPLRGTLRAAPGNPGTEVSLYPTSPSWRTAAPHGSLASLLIARFREEGLGGRRQVASRKEERSAALDILLSRYCEAGLD